MRSKVLRILHRCLAALALAALAPPAMAQLSVTLSAAPQTGVAPLTVTLSATISGCLPLVQPPVITSLGGNSSLVTAVISNPNNAPISLWRLVLATTTPNRLGSAAATPSGSAAARVPNAVSPAYGTNTLSSILYFDSDAAPTSMPVSNPLVIPANGTLSLTLRYDSPLGQGNKNIGIELYDTANQLAGTTNVNYESRWRFGDGSDDVLYSSTVSHTYASAGTYVAEFSLVCGGSTASATVTITVSPPAGSFDAVEVGAPRGSAIRTKVAAGGFNLDILTLSADRSALVNFTGTVKVELVDASAGGPVDAHGCNAAWPLIQRLPDLSFTNQNRRTTGNIVEGNAWPNVRLRIAYPASGTESSHACSSDAFAVRPEAFSAPVVSDADWATAGVARTLDNAASSGGPVHKAGRPFTVRTQALNAAGTLTTNYAGAPAATVTACAGTGCGAVLGSVTLGAGAVAGVLLSNAATYSEAGAFTLQIADQNFAAVDTTDSSAAERHFSSPLVTVGRFVPDRFELTAAAVPVLRTFNDATCAARSFTYLGQPFGYVAVPRATIAARNAAGALTASYRGALWKLSPAALTQTYAPLAPLSPALDVAGIGAPTLVSNGDGTGAYAASGGDLLVFVRQPTVPQTEFQAAITLTVAVADATEAAVAGNGSIVAVPLLFDGGGSGIAFDAGRLMRYGVLRLGNAYGSELIDLAIPLEAQYWNGYGFVANGADHCTSIVPANVKLFAHEAPAFAASMTSAQVSIGGRFAGGRARFALLKPAPAAHGAVSVCLDLDVGSGGDTSCQATAPAQMPWLQGRRSGSAYAQDPTARAAFGLYRPGGNLIYRWENF
jgi:MSHA biogenesis protein MshQ